MRNIRDQFPILDEKLIYLDSAATSQKPISVINAVTNFYTNQNANVRRGVYKLSENATLLYENSRLNLAKFINADHDELIFTSGTTDGVNFIAQAWGMQNIQRGDEIVVTELEHHSNFLPWQRLAQKSGAIFKVVPVLDNGVIDYNAFANIISPKTKLIAVTAQSNVTGIITDLNYINKLAKIVGAKLFVDAAQIVSHQKIDVKSIGCDFLAFSGHKMFGPTGIGCLFIKKDIQDSVEPYQVGGGMVFEVDLLKSTYLEAPYKFEAGTPKIAQAVGLSAAVDFINSITMPVRYDALSPICGNYPILEESKMPTLAHPECHSFLTKMNGVSKDKGGEWCECAGAPKFDICYLSKFLLGELKQFKDIRVIGAEDMVSSGNIVSFVHEKIHAHDLAAYFDQFGICVRAGNHCTQPLHKKLNINSSLRVSFAVYNTIQEVELFIGALKKIV